MHSHRTGQRARRLPSNRLLSGHRKLGGVERTRLEVTATHGGGYVYQVCPAAKVNTGTAAEIEACFASTPLEFAPGRHGAPTHLVVHADPSKDFEINATIVTEGGGKGWAFHPWPYASNAPCDWNPKAHGQHCNWGCPHCKAPWYAADGACPDDNCKHTTELPQTINYGKAFVGTPATANTIEDRVMVPKVPAGEYVLRWRWVRSASPSVLGPSLLLTACPCWPQDCEATSQVWT